MKSNGFSMKIRAKLLIAFLSIALLTVVVGGIGIYFNGHLADKSEMIAVKLAPLGDAAMEIKLSATTAHLVFEEIMGGDTTEDIQQVWDALDEALWYSDAILQGGENEEGTFFATEDPRVREKIESVRKDIEKFIKSAHERYTLFAASGGIGSEADQIFDDSYEVIQASLDTIRKSSQNISVVNLSGEAQYLTANGHLFLEELLGGDDENKIEDILNNFRKSKVNVERIGTLIGSNAVNPIIKNYEAFITSARKRYESMGTSVSAGSAADTAFDETYETFIGEADVAETLIHETMEEGMRAFHDVRNQSRTWMISVSAISFIIAILIAFRISNNIVTPITQTVTFANAMASGDLTQHLDLKTQDEFGELGEALNHTTETLSTMITKIRDMASTVASASEELSVVSTQLTKGTEEMAEQSKTVSAASEEMSNSINMISTATEEVSVSTNSVAAETKLMADSINAIAAATEETSASINDIAKNAQTGARISEKAMSLSTEASDTMNIMSEAAKEIGKVTEVIKRIAQQTNLLALNATIEAAAAGAAGKGFTVVSNEIKVLANQSSEAAEDIARRIADVQTTTENAVSIIAQVSETIAEINGSASEIASAVNQQNDTANEISSSLTKTTTSVETTSASIEELALGANEMSQTTSAMVESVKDVTSNIHGITKALTDNTAGVQQVNVSAQGLSTLASELETLLQQFQVS